MFAKKRKSAFHHIPKFVGLAHLERQGPFTFASHTETTTIRRATTTAMRRMLNPETDKVPGNCGTANFSDLGCRRLLLDFHLKNHTYIYTYICVYTQNHIDSYSILKSNNIKTKETNIQRSTIKQVRYQSCFLVYEFCGSKGLEKSSAMIGPVLSLV